MNYNRSEKAREWRKLYSLAAWRKGRLEFLSDNPPCRFCVAFNPDTPSPATVVDHIVRHEGDLDLFLDRSNWQGLCAPCHDQLKRQVELNGYHSMMGADGFPLDQNHPFNRAR